MFSMHIITSQNVCVCVSAVVVTLEPLVGAETYVNGKRITDGVALKQGDFFSVQFCVFLFPWFRMEN